MAKKVPLAQLTQLSSWLAAEHRQGRLRAGVWYQFVFRNGYAANIWWRHHLNDHAWPENERFVLVYTGHPDRISGSDRRKLVELAQTTTYTFEPVLVDVVFNHIERGRITLYSSRARTGFRYDHGKPAGRIPFAPPAEVR